MKFLLMVFAAALILGGLYHKDVERIFSQTGHQKNSTGVVKSVGSLGGSVETNLSKPFGQ